MKIYNTGYTGHTNLWPGTIVYRGSCFIQLPPRSSGRLALTQPFYSVMDILLRDLGVDRAHAQHFFALKLGRKYLRIAAGGDLPGNFLVYAVQMGFR